MIAGPPSAASIRTRASGAPRRLSASSAPRRGRSALFWTRMTAWTGGSRSRSSTAAAEVEENTIGILGS